jgi:HPt (histidine-containing phosphotransfer) domain-containing protein
MQTLDKSALVNLYNIGGKDFLLRMIDNFLTNTPSRIRSAQEHLKRRDWKAVHLVAHSLKASAANMGTTQVRDLSERIEEMASMGLERDLEEALAAMDVLLLDALRLLQNERDHWGNPSSGPQGEKSAART